MNEVDTVKFLIGCCIGYPIGIGLGIIITLIIWKFQDKKEGKY